MTTNNVDEIKLYDLPTEIIGKIVEENDVEIEDAVASLNRNLRGKVKEIKESPSRVNKSAMFTISVGTGAILETSREFESLKDFCARVCVCKTEYYYTLGIVKCGDEPIIGEKVDIKFYLVVIEDFNAPIKRKFKLKSSGVEFWKSSVCPVDFSGSKKLCYMHCVGCTFEGPGIFKGLTVNSRFIVEDYGVRFVSSHSTFTSCSFNNVSFGCKFEIPSMEFIDCNFIDGHFISLSQEMKMYWLKIQGGVKPTTMPIILTKWFIYGDIMEDNDDIFIFEDTTQFPTIIYPLDTDFIQEFVQIIRELNEEKATERIEEIQKEIHDYEENIEHYLEDNGY